MKRLAAAAFVLALAGCASQPKAPEPAPATADAPRKSPYPAAQEDPSKRGHYTAGGLYAPHIQDSAPDADIDVSLIPEPEVVALPRSRYGNRATYSVLGRQYKVMDDAGGYVERGMASYYGKKFHGRRTSNMEVYDMYAFTAAHKSLPLPSFAKVTHLDNGKSVVVRVNDRGPFHDGRIIDLSYAAAVKLGITRAGTGRVEVRALLPGESALMVADAGDGEDVVDTRTASAGPASTSMDDLVAALPLAAAAPASADADRQWRFDMRRHGKTMSADEFDAWMRERRVNVATGKPAVPAATAAAATSAPADAEPLPTMDATTVPAAGPVADTATAGDGVVLQVASFAGRANADRALAMLRDAGIDGARLQDASAAGRRVWRLRVGPLASDAVAALSGRITGLGFGPPQQIRE